jgi:hypothetical protein
LTALSDLQPGEKMFAIGAAHHDCYAYMVESEGLPARDLVDGGGQ